MSAINPRRAVGVYIQGYDGRYLLTQRGKSARNDRFCWEAPGGAVDEGETFEDAAVRELEEEIGVTVKLVDLIYEVKEVTDSDGVVWHTKVFLGELENPEEIVLERHKLAGFGWYTLEEMDNLNLASYCVKDVEELQRYIDTK